ncbi:rio kinase 2 [Vairimorpha apis BRL 01]|uniref:non-specific serine/threonine protein kinase n=1 Tax=Vairimorpha apis BRL 01 TaxID=1037528 RepID=T0MH44_9MICR|nr:rio kinase 2 [Vairimorpha apis BRL 01]
MILSMDGVWTISPQHLKILEIIEELQTQNFKSDFDVIKNKSKVQNVNGYLQDLIKLNFLKYDTPNYRLTISGIDCIAINALRKKGLEKMGTKIGVGKESDIYSGIFNGKNVALKFHRLGRTSFRSVKNKRDYTKGKIDWYKINKISCFREVNYYDLFKNLDVPEYITYNRHIIIMELLNYTSLYMIKLINPEEIYLKMINFIRELWHMGYVHGDFNEFNVMVRESGIKIIDFPQCLKSSHIQALDYLKRDIYSTRKYFEKKYNLIVEDNTFDDLFDSL